jgi:hypothetical protein
VGVAVAVAGSARRTRTSGCQQRAPGIDDLVPDRITAIEGSAERGERVV